VIGRRASFDRLRTIPPSRPKRIVDDDGLFFGRVYGLRDVVTFRGASVDELRADFEGAVDFYLDTCEKAGERPEKPYSGRFNVRLDSDLHREAALLAEAAGSSLNDFVRTAVKREVKRRRRELA
jgi:predicted HicB family RNase H-like nuclease